MSFSKMAKDNIYFLAMPVNKFLLDSHLTQLQAREIATNYKLQAVKNLFLISKSNQYLVTLLLIILIRVINMI